MFNYIFDRLTAEEKKKFNNYSHLQINSIKSENLSNINEATDKIIETKIFTIRIN
jgi:hypothetical protein